MKAALCQIYVGDKLVLQAKGLYYAGKKMKGLTTIVLDGTVGQVHIPVQADAVKALLTDTGTKNLEIRLSLL